MQSEKNLLRESLQALFDNSFYGGEGDLYPCYRALRTLEMEAEPVLGCDALSLSEISFSLAAACTVVTEGSEKCFVYCGDDTPPVIGSQRLIIKAALGLLSNAFLYGKGKLITLKTLFDGKNVLLEIRSGGGCDFAEVAEGRGLRFVRRVCRCHKGRLFIENDGDSTAAVMAFPKADRDLISAEAPDFYSLLKDRLSPVYVEFFGC